jgi:AcrR family transcriptional regulator
MTSASSPADPVAPVAPARTERQQARRRRILDAATGLAASGGFEAVQMRAVAESARVALGTLYRYFPSKIHLLLAVLHDQVERLHATLRERPLTERDPGERVMRTLKRAFRSHQREPRLAEAMLRALQFADASARAEAGAVSRLTTALLVDASGLTGAAARERMSAIRVIQHTWHSSLLYWLSGNTTLAEAHEDIETACRLLGPGPGGPPTRG